jgi:hypothetical protein
VLQGVQQTPRQSPHTTPLTSDAMGPSNGEHFNFSRPPSVSSTTLFRADYGDGMVLETEPSRVFTESLPPSVPPSTRNSGTLTVVLLSLSSTPTLTPPPLPAALPSVK